MHPFIHAQTIRYLCCSNRTRRTYALETRLAWSARVATLCPVDQSGCCIFFINTMERGRFKGFEQNGVSHPPRRNYTSADIITQRNLLLKIGRVRSFFYLQPSRSPPSTHSIFLFFILFLMVFFSFYHVKFFLAADEVALFFDIDPRQSIDC